MSDLKTEVTAKLDKLETKVDNLFDINSKQNVILAKMEVMFEKQQETLEEHQRRSLASENRLELMESKQIKMDTKFEKHLSYLNGAMGLIGLVSVIAGIVGVLVKLSIF